MPPFDAVYLSISEMIFETCSRS
jgi:hypothetical protein